MAATHEEITERLQKATLACNPLLCRLNEIGNVRKFSGGRTIIEELMFPVMVDTRYASSFYYSGYEAVTSGQYRPANDLHKTCTVQEESGIFTAAEYPIRQAATTMHRNSPVVDGVDPVEEVIKSVAKMVSNTISSEGVRDSFNSLPALVSTSPTIGVVGGIDRHHYRFWRNLAVSYDKATSLSYLVRIMLDRLTIMDEVGSKKTRRPDLVLMGKDDFDEFYNNSPELEGTMVVLDPNIKPMIENYAVQHSRIYFLHTEYFHWRFHEDRNWKMLDPDRFCAEAQPEAKKIDLYAMAGNLTLSCSYAQGVLYRVS